MNPQEKKRILDAAGKKTAAQIAKDLGIKERKVKKLLAPRKDKHFSATVASKPALLTLEVTPIDAFIKAMRPGALFLALFLMAFLIKLIVLICFEKSIFANLLILDMADYDKWAVEISRGKIIGDSVFNALPFYPYILGLVYFMAGHSLSVARFLQIIIGSASCVLVFILAKRLFTPTVGLIAFFSMLLFREFYAYEMLILPTTIGIFFYLIIIVMFFRALEKPGLPVFAVLGVLTGCSALNRAYMLFLIALIPIATVLSIKTSSFKRYLYAGVFIICAIVAILTATVHNYLAGKDFVPITAHGGVNFFVGNNPKADGLNIRVPFPVGRGSHEMLADMRRIAEKEEGHALKPSEVSAFWSSQAKSFISENPSLFWALLLTKLNAFFCGFDISDMLSSRVMARYVPLLGAFFLDFRWIVPFAVLGIILSFSRKRELLILYAVIVSHVVSILLFIVVGRYRLAIAPFLIVFWALCIVYLIKCAGSRNLPKLAAVILVSVVLFTYLNNPAFRKKYELNPGANYTYIGGYFLDKKEYAQAIEFFRQAVLLEPDRAEAHNMLGLGYSLDGKYEDAVKEFAAAISLNPGLYQAHNNLGAMFERMSMPDRAASEFKRSIQINPSQPGIRSHLDSIRPGRIGGTE